MKLLLENIVVINNEVKCFEHKAKIVSTHYLSFHQTPPPLIWLHYSVINIRLKRRVFSNQIMSAVFEHKNLY